LDFWEVFFATHANTQLMPVKRHSGKEGAMKNAMILILGLAGIFGSVFAWTDETSGCVQEVWVNECPSQTSYVWFSVKLVAGGSLVYFGASSADAGAINRTAALLISAQTNSKKIKFHSGANITVEKGNGSMQVSSVQTIGLSTTDCNF
jgi:hypothetical protein